jgi:SagB-type dehydrogenase family enzyme
MTEAQNGSTIIELPAPCLDGAYSLEAVIARRRTGRDFDPRPLTRAQIGQLLWAAAGITDPESGKRAAPSAGARYPLEHYVVLPEGLYHYLPASHSLELVVGGDARAQLASATWQDFVGQAPCTIAISAVFQRTTDRYSQRGQDRYVPMDVGHAAQNVLLQAVALGLVGCPVGSFDDERVASALRLPPQETPLYLLPVGIERPS